MNKIIVKNIKKDMDDCFHPGKVSLHIKTRLMHNGYFVRRVLYDVEKDLAYCHVKKA